MDEKLDDIIAYLRLGRMPLNRTQSVREWADYLDLEVRPRLVADAALVAVEKRGPGRPRKVEAES